MEEKKPKRQARRNTLQERVKVLLHQKEELENYIDNILNVNKAMAEKVNFIATAALKGVDPEVLFKDEIDPKAIFLYEIKVLEEVRDKTPCNLFVKRIFKSVVNARIEQLKTETKKP